MISSTSQSFLYLNQKVFVLTKEQTCCKGHSIPTFRVECFTTRLSRRPKKSLDYVLQGVQVRAGPRVQRHLAEVQLPQDEGAEAEKVEAATETEENQRI